MVGVKRFKEQDRKERERKENGSKGIKLRQDCFTHAFASLFCACTFASAHSLQTP